MCQVETMSKVNVRRAFDQPRLCEPRTMLREYSKRSDEVLPSDFRDMNTTLKREAVQAGDQVTAKAIWCMETIGRIQDHFVSAFANMKSSNYKKAWDQLERCEIEIKFLDDHFTDDDGDFGIEHCRVHTSQFQELYQLKLGVSPGILCKEIRCSICNSRLTLRSGCSHKIGEIYDGEYCGRTVVDFDILHVALVENPAQRFSVIFPEEDLERRFSLVNYVCRGLRSPWHSWSYKKEERRQHHPAFRRLGPNDLCACGSKVKYKRCCLNKDTVLPHFQFLFEYRPPESLGELRIYSKYEK